MSEETPFTPRLGRIVVIHQVVAMPGDSVVGLSLVAVGYPVYRFWTRQSHAKELAT